MASIKVILGDITTLKVDAIVNAANSALRVGGGVDRAINLAAGPRLQDACRDIGSCPTGEAVITPGFDLTAAHVIHTVGPVWQGGGAGEAGQLASCYRSSLAIADGHGLASVAFPAISCGVYGFPAEQAAHIAVHTVREQLLAHPAIELVVFCLFSDVLLQIYRDELTRAPRA